MEEDVQYLLASQSEHSLLTQHGLLKKLVVEIQSQSSLDSFRHNETGHKLFKVIVDGLISKLESPDRDADSLSLMKACLKVIRNILDQLSTVLVSYNRGEFKWLGSRIIPFLAVSQDNDLTAELVQTAICILYTLSAKPELWNVLVDYKSFIMDYLDVLVGFVNSKSQVDILNCTNFGYSYIFATKKEVAATALSLIRSLIISGKACKNNSLVILAIEKQYLGACMTVLLNFLCINKLRIDENFKEMEVCHTLFLDACCRGMQLFDRLFYLCMQWIQSFYDLACEYSNSIFEKTYCRALLTTALHISKSKLSLQSNYSTAFCSAMTNQLELTESNLLENIGLATMYVMKSIDQTYSVNTHATFTVDILEKKRKKLLIYWNKTSKNNRDVTSLSQDDSELEKFRMIFNDVSSPQSINSMGDLNSYIATRFNGLNRIQKLKLVKKIGRLACALSNHFVSSYSMLQCRVCDRLNLDINKPRGEYNGFKQAFISIIRSDNFQQDLKLRLEAVESLRHVLASFCQEFYFDTSTDLGIWLIGCIRSTSRDLRLAVIKLLPYFVSMGEDEEVDTTISYNVIFKTLSDINFDEDMYLMETTVMAWSQLAKVSEGERLTIVLMKLIDVLSSKNSYHSSVAFLELQGIARYKKCTFWQLCSPFWSTISVMVVKRLEDRSDLLTRFVELLEIPQTDFLYRTISYTIPYLIAAKQYGIVMKIARTCGYKNAKQIYLDHVPVILAVLLTQDCENPGLFAQQRWFDADVSFKTVEFSAVVSPHIVRTSFEILKLYQGDDDESPKTQRIVNALRCVGSVKYPSAKSNDAIFKQLFNDNNVLQLVALFSDTIRNVFGKMAYTTKLQCLRGILMMIKCAPSTFISAVPQICAFLQSALDTDLLQQSAISAWSVMIQYLPDSYFEDMIDLTISMVLRKWSFFTRDAKLQSIVMLREMAFNRGAIIKKRMEDKGIPLLHDIVKLEEILLIKPREEVPFQKLRKVITRLGHGNVYVVQQALIELIALLHDNQTDFHAGLNSTKTLNIIRNTMRLVLDVSFRFGSSNTEIPILCAQCLGHMGALDDHKVDVSPERKDLIVTSNFEEAAESVEFVVTLVQDHLVRAFRASTDPNQQMFLAYGIQEYLKFCNLRPENLDSPTSSRIWSQFNNSSKSTLMPLLSSKYAATPTAVEKCSYPIYRPNITYVQWLKTFAYDLIASCKGSNAQKIFAVCRRSVKDTEQNLNILNFILPYMALNVVLSDSNSNRANIAKEIWVVLSTPYEDQNYANVQSSQSQSSSSNEPYSISTFHQAVFSIIDYFSKWTRERRKFNMAARRSLRIDSDDLNNDDDAIAAVIDVLDKISPDLLAQRSFECKSYPRAVMYWEEHLRTMNKDIAGSEEIVYSIYQKFQQIYANIDDPDALDGISTRLPTTDLNQQILRFENTGRWDSALECYEVLMKKLNQWDIPVQTRMLNCFKESGRYDDLLARLDSTVTKLDLNENIPEDWTRLGIEVSWLSGNFMTLENWLSKSVGSTFEANVGNALLALKNRNRHEVQYGLERALENLASDFAVNNITSLAQCRESLVKLHALTDLDGIAVLSLSNDQSNYQDLIGRLNSRLEAIGVDYAARQYLLSLRRSAMSISGFSFATEEIAATWISTAHDARKLDHPSLALRASLQAQTTEPKLSTVESAKLLWQQGEHRRATAALESILDKKFLTNITEYARGSQIDRADAKHALLYTKWLDSSGQEGSDKILSRYKALARLHPRWEKPHYLYAKYFNKIYDSQLALPEAMRSKEFTEGYYVKMMITEYIRSLYFGVKHIYETLPKVITVWLDFSENLRKLEKSSKSPVEIITQRKVNLKEINSSVEKFVSKIPAYILYVVLPQLLSRISHANDDVYKVLQATIIEIGRAYPCQALWYVYSAVRSNQDERSKRGQIIINKLKSMRRTPTSSTDSSEPLSTLVFQAEKIITSLQHLCYRKLDDPKMAVASLAAWRFDTSAAKCDLVVPVQSIINATLPSHPDAIKNHDAFSTYIRMNGIEDMVIIQHSLQKPRRISIIGSDGAIYKILCKPNDDVRKDARLMDFTSVIDKLLTRVDAASRRHLRITTYNVQPINEDCGLIEWVDGAEPMKNIIVKNYGPKGIAMNWVELKALKAGTLEESLSNYKFLIDKYPAVLYEWFIEKFPDPTAWLESRNRFVRSTAVMSMVGYILGLGDRHGENILFIAKSGNIMHVDFDCLFDKGVDFETPERVPFRLTKNMVDAMGVMGYEGSFRRASEVTLQILRQHEDMLMTILETFLHDPIVDWAVKRHRKTDRRVINGLTAAKSPQEALSSIRDKIRGLKGQDGIPLSVSGQVEYLIQQAINEINLCQMYIGWLAFQ